MDVTPSFRTGSRRSLTVAALAVAAGLSSALMSSCSVTAQDAARVNGEHLSESDFNDLLEAYATAAQSAVLPSGNLDANAARRVLVDWIDTIVLEDMLTEYGIEVTEADMGSARTSLEQQGGFSAAPVAVQNFYVRATAVRDVTGAAFSPNREELSGNYATGPKKSGIACLRIILTDTQADMDAAIARIEAGESFADVASAVSKDSSSKDGGALIDTQADNACFSFDALAQQILPELAQVLTESKVGVMTEPLEVPDLGWVVLLPRPFSEVADDAMAIMGPMTTTKITNSAIESASIWVDPKYGRWDPATRQVQPLDK